MIVVPLWLVCGIAAAIIGAQKNAGCTSAIGGFILGPIGLLWVIVSPGNTMRCIACDKRISLRARKCPFCQEIQPKENWDDSSMVRSIDETPGWMIALAPAAIFILFAFAIYCLSVTFPN